MEKTSFAGRRANTITLYCVLGTCSEVLSRRRFTSLISLISLNVSFSLKSQPSSEDTFNSEFLESLNYLKREHQWSQQIMLKCPVDLWNAMNFQRLFGETSGHLVNYGESGKTAFHWSQNLHVLYQLYNFKKNRKFVFIMNCRHVTNSMKDDNWLRVEKWNCHMW